MAIDPAYAVIQLNALRAPLVDIGYTVVPDDDVGTLHAERTSAGADAGVIIGLRPSPAEQIRLVFLDAPYSFRPDDGVSDDVRESLRILTAHLPFGSIEQDDDGSVHARWTIPTDAAETLDDELVVTSIVMFDLVQQHFGDYVDGICNGDIPSSILESLIERAGDAQ